GRCRTYLPVCICGDQLVILLDRRRSLVDGVLDETGQRLPLLTLPFAGNDTPSQEVTEQTAMPPTDVGRLPPPARASHRRERLPSPSRVREEHTSNDGDRLSTKGSTGHGPCGQKGGEAMDSDEGPSYRTRRISNCTGHVP